MVKFVIACPFIASFLNQIIYAFVMINNLMEIPLLSLMDGDLLGLIDPAQKSPENWINYAYKSLQQQYNESGKYFNLNFHPWLIGSENRLILLDKILNYIKNKRNNKFILAKEINK